MGSYSALAPQHFTPGWLRNCLILPPGVHSCHGTCFRCLHFYGNISVSARGSRFDAVIALSAEYGGLLGAQTVVHVFLCFRAVLL